ncbi:MAG: hypothetical protein BGN85_07970 [Alphaproteobacteria bacterium 64-11]|nr:DUF2239 family protein [Alphaproteobacteria bacterium]OJU10771.1 MAG: hypothetical protein BGN85_07970 [Alphaproteobacteria bacterium 64-11]
MTHVAFSGFDRLASGTLAEVYAACPSGGGALIFDTETGRVVDVDPRFPPGAEVARPGRPRLGVVAREVTLLPRHWDWLASQPGGASVALRELVEAASRSPKARMRARRDAVYRLATALVGDAPAYEEAMRALYAGAREDFLAHIEPWPTDVRRVLEEISSDAF